ncbi:MAG: ATP synthase F1 subunit gamma [SAR324 cluster bacterium]|nr:ATP synthase F1 subunit gamma [SAR324 cluster bacterium]
MASLKEIRKRIESVKTTQKTTSAMKMVSAAKLKRAQDNFQEATPYASKLKRVVSVLSANFSEEEHPLFARSEGERTAVILITSDRGLCGGFNSNLCKALLKELEEQKIDAAHFTIIGRKGAEYFKRTDHTILQNYTSIPVTEQSVTVKTIVKDHIEKFEKNEIDRVYLAYSHFVSVLTQDPAIQTLLPIEPLPSEELDEREILFEPSAEKILDTLLKKYVENQVAVAWLDSIAGEHGARMTSMDSATKNAGELIDKLQLYYNRTRQAAITSELIEIISGAESL